MTVHARSVPSRSRRIARSPPGERSSDNACPEASSIVTPASPGELMSTGSSVSLMSCRRVCAEPVQRPRPCVTAPGSHPRREASQPQNNSPDASESARWVCAADELHHANTILADLRRTIDPNSVWSRFSGGRDHTIQGHRRVYDRLTEVGFTGEIMREFGAVIIALEEWSDTTASYGA